MQFALEEGIISIHSLRMEGDYKCAIIYTEVREFQSTPSAWRETRKYNVTSLLMRKFQSTPSAWRETTEVREKPRTQNISIHSLRMEGDLAVQAWSM